jgi:uncharacterized membrane protein
MAWIKTILQVIVALPSILKLVLDIIKTVRDSIAAQKAQAKYEEAKKENAEVAEKIEKAESREEAQSALDRAASKWGKRGKN